MNDNHSPRRRARVPADIAVAALLAIGAFAEGSSRHRRAWLTAIPVIGVNFVAFYGQLAYFRSHRHVQPGITVPVAVSVVLALALESIAIYLAWQAHLARLANDSALRLRLGAYSAALVIGALNYSHFCGPRWQPDAYAVAFALASVISPALWGVYSNRESRDDLKAQGLIEDHAVRLGLTRWFWHSWRSPVVMWHATWAGVSRLDEAIALWQPRKARQPGEDPAPSRDAAAPNPSSPGPSRRREPLKPGRDTAPARAPVRAARAAGLAAASEHEQQVVLRLLGSGAKLPGRRPLAESDFGGSIRAAERVLALVRARQNGGGHG